MQPRIFSHGLRVLAAAGTLFWCAGLTGAAAASNAATPSIVEVCQGCRFTTIPAALAAAPVGSTVRVEGGHYRGPVVIKRTVRLLGIGRPVIDGEDQGTVVRITAPDARFEGFDVRGSGISLDHEDTGVAVEAPRVVLADDHLVDVLFGIYLKDAPASRIERNTVIGKPLSLARRGDGIRVWYSKGVIIRGNRVVGARDDLLWFSPNSVLAANEFRDGRYGIHFMYSNECRVIGNRLEGNAVGGYFMYSVGLDLRGNIARGNRGPTGMGIGIRDTDQVTALANLMIDNRIGLALFNSPRSVDVTNSFVSNVIADNDVGVALDSSLDGDVFSRNDFLDNLEQVGTRGEGTLHGVTWSVGGQGNYWSDYAGYDADGDGRGDVPYTAHRTFESLADAHPELRLFLLSPSTMALDWAASAFPVFQPQTKFSDPAPLVRPIIPESLSLPPAPRVPLAEAAGAFTLAGLAVVAFLVLHERPFSQSVVACLATRAAGRLGGPRPRDKERDDIREARLLGVDRASPATPRPTVRGGLPDAQGVRAQDRADDAVVLEIRGLSKSFGSARVVRDVSFAVRPGEAVALWGPNGAGKTTVLRCLLGLLRSDGEIRVAGRDLRRHRKDALRSLGYVAQEPAFHNDLTVSQTMVFYARVRGATPAEIARLLELTGMIPHAAKTVTTLSGGMRRKLALAVALLVDPPILLLDEPTANLDEQSRQELLALLAHLKRRGTALLIASHHADELRVLADRVLVLENGVLTAEVAPESLAQPRRARLVIPLPETQQDRAAEILGDLGYAVARAGDCLLVTIGATGKAQPLLALARAGLAVDDFELESAPWAE